MILLRFLLSAVIVTASLVSGNRQAEASLKAADTPSVLREVNRERVRAGLPPLALDTQLSRVAQAHANDMSRRRYFSHVTPEGIDPFARMRRARVRFHAAGENLSLADNVLQAQNLIWNDAPHRKILLTPAFHKLGIGTSRTGDGAILVEDFSD
jgi:uncharacterized protein YkwD